MRRKVQGLAGGHEGSLKHGVPFLPPDVDEAFDHGHDPDCFGEGVGRGEHNVLRVPGSCLHFGHPVEEAIEWRTRG